MEKIGENFETPAPAPEALAEESSVQSDDAMVDELIEASEIEEAEVEDPVEVLEEQIEASAEPEMPMEESSDIPVEQAVIHERVSVSETARVFITSHKFNFNESDLEISCDVNGDGKISDKSETVYLGGNLPSVQHISIIAENAKLIATAVAPTGQREITTITPEWHVESMLEDPEITEVAA